MMINKTEKEKQKELEECLKKLQSARYMVSSEKLENIKDDIYTSQIQEVIEENNQEAQEEVEKAEEEAKQNPELPKADTSMYTDEALEPMATFKGITVDELRNKTQAEFDAISNQWMASLLSGIIPGGNSGGSSGSSNQQDDEIYDPEADWGSLSDNPNIGVFDFSSWGDAPAGGM